MQLVRALLVGTGSVGQAQGHAFLGYTSTVVETRSGAHSTGIRAGRPQHTVQYWGLVAALRGGLRSAHIAQSSERGGVHTSVDS